MPITRGSKVSLKILQSVLDVSEDAIVCTGTRHDVVWINSKAQSLLGVPLIDIQNTAWEQFIETSSKDEYLTALESLGRTFSPEKKLSLQLKYIRMGHPQNAFSAQVQIKIIKYRNSWLAVHFIKELKPSRPPFTHSFDISDKSIIGNELQDFSYILSHESSDPLRKIIAFSERLDRGYRDQLGEKGKTYLGCMGKAVKKFQKLVDDLKYFSRISTQPGEIRLVSLSEIVAEVISDNESIISQTQSRIQVGDLPILQADPRQMRMLFRQLISNSLKFRNTKQAIQINLSSRKMKPGLWEIIVEDNGIGFHNEYAERIFSPCERLHGNADYRGTGMGLTICRKVAARHHGTLTAEGRPGQGARFTLTLPEKQLPKTDPLHN